MAPLLKHTASTASTDLGVDTTVTIKHNASNLHKMNKPRKSFGTLTEIHPEHL